MEVVVKAGTLAEEMAVAVRVAGTKRDVLPRLQYALFSTEQPQVTITATDDDLMIRTACVAEIREEGELLLHAQRLADLARLWPADADVRIASGKKGEALVACGAYSGRLQTLPVVDFSRIPDAQAPLADLPWKPFRRAIDQVKYTIAPHVEKYQTSGACLSLDGDQLTLVTTDGHRLSVASATLGAPVPTAVEVLIPRKALTEILALGDGDAMGFARTENHLFFSTATRLLTVRAMDGKFPNYTRLIPKAHDKRVVVARDALRDALRRVAVVSTGSALKSVEFVLTQDQIKLSTLVQDVGDAEEVILAQYDGPAFSAKFQADYLMDALDAASVGNVEMQFKDPNEACLITQLGDGGQMLTSYRYVTMPIIK